MADVQNQADVGGKKPKVFGWPFLVILAAAVILSLGGGVFVRWLVERNNVTQKTRPQLAPEIREVQDLVSSNKPAEAEKKIADILAKPNVSKDVKFSLYLQQGTNLYEKKKYQEALESYTKAFEIRPTFAVAQSIASVWIVLDDKQKAIQYFQRAIELIPQDHPTRDDDVRLIKEQIKMLESES